MQHFNAIQRQVPYRLTNRPFIWMTVVSRYLSLCRSILCLVSKKSFYISLEIMAGQKQLDPLNGSLGLYSYNNLAKFVLCTICEIGVSTNTFPVNHHRAKHFTIKVNQEQVEESISNAVAALGAMEATNPYSCSVRVPVLQQLEGFKKLDGLQCYICYYCGRDDHSLRKHCLDVHAGHEAKAFLEKCRRVVMQKTTLATSSPYFAVSDLNKPVDNNLVVAYKAKFLSQEIINPTIQDESNDLDFEEPSKNLLQQYLQWDAYVCANFETPSARLALFANGSNSVITTLVSEFLNSVQQALDGGLGIAAKQQLMSDSDSEIKFFRMVYCKVLYR